MLLLLAYGATSASSATNTFRAYRTYSAGGVITSPYTINIYDLEAVDGSLKPKGAVLANATGAILPASTQAPTALINNSIAVLPAQVFHAGHPLTALAAIDLKASGTAPAVWTLTTTQPFFGVQYSPKDDLIFMLGAVRAGAGDQMQAYSLHTHGQAMTKLATATMTTRIGLTGANAFDVDNRKLYIVVGTEAPAYAPSLFTYDVAANTLTQGVINAENLEIVELGVASDGTLHAVAANMSTSALPEVVLGTIDPSTGKFSIGATVGAAGSAPSRIYRGTCHFDKEKKEWWSLMEYADEDFSRLLHIDAATGVVLDDYSFEDNWHDWDPYGCLKLN